MSYASIPGWMNFEEVYDDFVTTAPEGSTLVEVGVAFGRSLAYLARRAIDSRKNLKVIGVDPFFMGVGPMPPQDREMEILMIKHGSQFAAFEASMKEHAPEELDFVQVVKKTSLHAAKKIGPCHAVFIDASHEYEDVKKDIQTWGAKIQPGGILAGHDYDKQFPGVVQAVHEAFGFGGFQVRGTSWVVRK